MCNKVAVIVSGVCGVIWVCPFEYNCVYNLSPKKPLLLCKKKWFYRFIIISVRCDSVPSYQGFHLLCDVGWIFEWLGVLFIGRGFVMIQIEECGLRGVFKLSVSGYVSG